MNQIDIKARAKINLTLDVLGKRPDGYHEVEMVMQTVELHDLVTVSELSDGIELETTHPSLECGETNIAYKAAKFIKDRFGIKQGVKIFLDKKIPLAAGLAGGSADAAAVLKGLNRLWSLGLTLEQLAELGAAIGSDVPFCVHGGTAVATGRGERLTKISDIQEMWLVLAKPPVAVSTAEVYRNFRLDRVVTRPRTKEMLRAIETGNVQEITRNLANVLESVTLERYPEVSMLKSTVKDAGAAGVLMSGSGPTVFGIMENEGAASSAAEEIRLRRPGIFVEVTRTWPGETEGI